MLFCGSGTESKRLGHVFCIQPLGWPVGKHGDHRCFGPVITGSLSPTWVFRERRKTARGPIFSAAPRMANRRLSNTLCPVHGSTQDTFSKLHTKQ